jgi:ParB family transcriptional regulator, chromosome partitioning protein
MTRKGGLGRGLESLIPGNENIPAGSVLQVPVDKVVPNPRQPRSHIDPAELEELTASIREHGVIQPLILTEGEQDGWYTLIAGERRLLAARQAGLDSVPAILRQVSEQQRLELALIENIQRADLGPLEAAEAYRQLADDFNLSHEEISARVGKSRVTVTNTLRLLKLSAEGRDALTSNLISEGHARALLALPSAQAQDAALSTILKQELNVRQTEELVRKLCGQKPLRPEKPASTPEVLALEERLRNSLGTRINLKHGKRGGHLTIFFFSDEELDTIASRLLRDET